MEKIHLKETLVSVLILKVIKKPANNEKGASWEGGQNDVRKYEISRTEKTMS